MRNGVGWEIPETLKIRSGWTQQDRSRTPSTPIWSSRLYKSAQNVKPTFHSLLLHGLFQFIQIPRKPSLEPKKNPDLNGRDFFLLLPSSLATQGQDLRVQHSLVALTRHPGRNEQKYQSVGRCSSGRHPIRRRPAYEATRRWSIQRSRDRSRPIRRYYL